METIAASMSKSNQVEYPVAEVIEKRRSRRAYAAQPIEPEKIKSLFEAARWAPSSMNEQPWTYIYATKDQPDLWNKLLDLLNDSNRVWAINAPLLILSLSRKAHLRNGAGNALARYDTGSANALLSIQATQLGLNVHQMGGYDRQKAIDSLHIPEAYDPIVVMAIGYPGDPESLSENLKLREVSPRERYTQESFVMNNCF